MKNCLNCGTQNADEAKFCVQCGQDKFTQAQQQYQQQQYYQQPPKKKKGKAGRVILIVLAVIIGLAIISSLFDDAPSEADTTTAITTTEATTDPTTSETTTRETTTEATTTETTLSDEEIQEAIEFQRQYYEEVDYKSAARNPNDFLEKQIKITGTVIQVIEDDVAPAYRIAQNDDYDAIWYVSYFRIADSPRVLEDDTVTVYGSGMGLITYTATLGGEISIPGISSMDIEIIE
jgi:predicted  nucleic acid-binding Zn-ribbon protein